MRLIPVLLRRAPQRGQGLTEYALIIGLVAIAVVAALTLFGNQLVAYYITSISDVLDTVSS
ncbi:MAG: Flp family type IVb pilin [bacterium]